MDLDNDAVVASLIELGGSPAPVRNFNENWPLMRLSHAAAALGVYTVIVVAGLILRSRDGKPAQPRVDVAALTPAQRKEFEEKERKRKQLSLGMVFTDPLRASQIVYNVVQVGPRASSSRAPRMSWCGSCAGRPLLVHGDQHHCDSPAQEPELPVQFVRRQRRGHGVS
jgi:hypothetical protein